jgi:hypothetical protein
MNLWGRTAGMATMRLTSAQTAVSIGEFPMGWGWCEGRVGAGRPGSSYSVALF